MACLAAGVAAAVLLAGAVRQPAWGDTVILVNGDHVRGELEATEFPVTTPTEAVRVPSTSVALVTLGTITGDIVELRSGRTLSGLVHQTSYTIRLGSGNTIVLPRHHVAVIRFGAR